MRIFLIATLCLAWHAPASDYVARATAMCPIEKKHAGGGERTDAAYLKWKATWIEHEANLLKRDDLHRRGGLSPDDEFALTSVPDGWSSTPPPESLLTDASGSPSMKANFTTYFFWPVLIGAVVVVLLRNGRVILGGAAVIGLLFYIERVSSQVGVGGFFVWIFGFLLVVAVLRFLFWLFVSV